MATGNVSAAILRDSHLRPTPMCEDNNKKGNDMPGITSHLLRAALTFAALLSFPASFALAQTADTVLFNGKILTVDKDFSVQQAIAIAQRPGARDRHTAAMKKLAGDKAKTDRSRRPHRDSRPDRRPHPRRPRRTDLRHRSELDRRADAEGGAGENPRRPQKRKSPAPGSSSPAAGPRSNSPKNGGRPAAEVAGARAGQSRFTSSISMTGCC